MKLSNKIIKTLKNPKWFIVFLNNRGFHLLDDEDYLKLLFKLLLGKDLDLSNPDTFNEKLQWLKLHDRRTIYTTMVDKYKVKEYVAKKLGKKYIIPTLGIYDRFDDIDFDKLPNRFVMKCTHDSGGLVICKNKTEFNRRASRKKINKCLKKNFYWSGREWPYKNVEPRIIIEEYISSFGLNSVNDYKFFCFNGKPELILVCSDRFSKKGLKKTWFDSSWNLLPLTEGGRQTDETIKKPKHFELMKCLAEKLSKDIMFVRVDFYEVDKKVYFGEITFFPNSGFEKFSPESWDKKLGDLINLKNIKKV